MKSWVPSVVVLVSSRHLPDSRPMIAPSERNRHCWLVAPVHDHNWTRVLSDVPRPRTSAQLPLIFSVPLDEIIQSWAPALLLQSQASILFPLLAEPLEW